MSMKMAIVVAAIHTHNENVDDDGGDYDEADADEPKCQKASPNDLVFMFTLSLLFLLGFVF